MVTGVMNCVAASVIDDLHGRAGFHQQTREFGDLVARNTA